MLLIGAAAPVWLVRPGGASAGRRHQIPWKAAAPRPLVQRHMALMALHHENTCATGQPTLGAGHVRDPLPGL